MLPIRWNRQATVAPTVNDDTDGGYRVGSFWFDRNTDTAYICFDATDGAAVWLPVRTDTGGGAWGEITGTLSDQTDLQAALSARQPLDADLTAIAALTTTTYGRSLLTLSDQAALQSAVGALDHGGLSGLADNDHPQYPLKAGDTFTGDVTINGANLIVDGILLDGDSVNGWVQVMNAAGNAYRDIVCRTVLLSTSLGSSANRVPTVYAGEVTAATGRIGGLSGAAGGGEILTVATNELSGRAGLRLIGNGANNSNFCGILFLDRIGNESWSLVLDGELTYGGGNNLSFRRWSGYEALRLDAGSLAVSVSPGLQGAVLNVGDFGLQYYTYASIPTLFSGGRIMGTHSFSMANVWGSLPTGLDRWFDLNQTSGMNLASNIPIRFFDATYISNDTNADWRLRRTGANLTEIDNGSGGSAVLNIIGRLNTDCITFDVVDDGSSGASKTIDWSLGNRHKLTLTATCTMTWTAPAGNASLELRFTEDGTGGWDFNLPGNAYWLGGSAPTLTKTAGARILLTVSYHADIDEYIVTAANF